MIKPLPGYVLIEPIEEDSVSAGGVYVPDTSKDKPMKGRVVSVDQSQTEYESSFGWHRGLRVGSIVVYKKWTNQEIQHEGKEYLLVHFNELLAIIE